MQDSRSLFWCSGLDRLQQSPPQMAALIFGLSAHRKFKLNTFACQLFVNLTVGIQPVVNSTTLLLVQHNFRSLCTILAGPDTLADNFNRIDEVAKNCVVDGSKGTRARALLLLSRTGTIRAPGSGKNAARSDHENVAVGELLFKLARKTARNQSRSLEQRCRIDLPLLHLVEALE